MAKRRFAVTLESIIILDLDERIIELVDGNWREMYDPYTKTPEDIACYVAHDMYRFRYGLSHVDGFVGADDSMATIYDSWIEDLSATEGGPGDGCW